LFIVPHWSSILEGFRESSQLVALSFYIYIYNKNGQGIFKIFFIISRLNISASHKTSDVHWIDGFRKKYYFFRFSLKFNNKRIIINKSLSRLNQYLKGFVPFLVRYYHSQATYQIEIQYSGMSFFLYKNGVLSLFFKLFMRICGLEGEGFRR
jgi:hypothetical protein